MVECIGGEAWPKMVRDPLHQNDAHSLTLTSGLSDQGSNTKHQPNQHKVSHAHAHELSKAWITLDELPPELDGQPVVAPGWGQQWSQTPSRSPG